MANTIRKFTGTITVTSGTGSLLTSADDQFSSLRDAGGDLRQVLLKAPGTSDIFDFKLTDSDSFDVFEKKNVTGKINDTTNIPIRGIYTLTISEASVDGTYSYKLLMEEKW